MAGVVPKRSASGRKQWTLHDGGSIKRLRNQMASDGCPESQVVLAKQLLDEPCKLEAETRENERLGVYWLIKASQQGNAEATTILKTCLETGKGITELNYIDVKACITMTQDEKLARKAAREMFASMSNGGDYVTSDQLQRKILAIERSPPEKLHHEQNGHLNGELVFDSSPIESDDDDTDWSNKSDSGNEKLTEDNLVSAAVDYSHGLLPFVNRSLCLSEPPLHALDQIPVLQRSILHPWLALVIIYWKIIRFFGRKRFSLPIMFKSEFQLFLLVVFYTVFNFEGNVAYLLPMIGYYFTFLVMLVTTCEILQTKREFHDFRLWSGLFICYSAGDLNSEQAEYRYICNNLKPYGVFFVSFLTNLLIYPIIAEQWIPQSEVMIISFFFTFVTLLGFMHKKRGRIMIDFTILFSFGINILAKYPYETDLVVAQGWRFADLKIPTFGSYILGNGIDFCINFRAGLYFSIPLLLIKMAAGEKWRGTYKRLIPHCVTLAWLQVCIIAAKGATMYGLLRGGLALVGLVLFLPLVGLTSVLIPAVALTKWLVSSSLTFGVVCFVLVAAVALVVSWKVAQSRWRRIGALIQIFSTFIGVSILLKSADFGIETGIVKFEFFEGDLAEFLPWEVYQRFCHQPVWLEENVGVAQVKCSQLEGVSVNWDGYINEIKVQSVENRYSKLFAYFPKGIRQTLNCFFGEETNNDCETFPEDVREDCFTMHNAMKSVNFCTLEKYNVFRFELAIRMNSGIWGKGAEVIVQVEHFFKNFTLKLKPNDHIWFKGHLFNNEKVRSDDGVLGGLKTHVRLDEIGCLACSNRKLSNLKRPPHDGASISRVVDSLAVGTKFVFNMLLNPVLIFK